MNILDVKIPSVLYDRELTGIEWLDTLMTVEGGLVPSLVYMIAGVPGAGKSTLTRQVADGLTGNGCVVLYNSGEESKEQIAIGVRRLKLKNGFEHASETDVVKLLARLDKLQKANPKKRIVLIQDSIQKLHSEDNSSNASFQLLKEWAKTTLNIVICISQVTKSGAFKGSNEVAHDADTHIEMHFSKKTGQRSMHFIKNRFGLTTADGFTYDLTDAGLVPAETIIDEETNFAPYPVAAGDWLITTDEAPPKHRGKRAKVKNVGRTRIEAFTAEGVKLYLPFTAFAPLEVTESNDPSNVFSIRAAK